MAKLFFAPEGKKHGDFSFVEKDGKIYNIFIENDKDSEAVTEGVSHGNSFGLAVSEDGLEWKYLGKVKSPGRPGTWNDKSLWAMHVFKDDKSDDYLMIYSAISTAEEKELRHPTQQFGMARSKDLREWQDLDENPVIKNTDTGKHYYPKNMHRFCWRDANIHKSDGNHVAILSASDITKPHELSGCTGLLKTQDFTEWEAMPPLFSPGRYREIETPHLYKIEGRWWLIYGENAHSMAMRFAVSDEKFGSYTEPELNVFTPAQCYAGIIFPWKGKHYFYHWIMDKVKGKNERYLSPPTEVDVTTGNLLLKKHAQLDTHYKQVPGDNLLQEIKDAEEQRAVYRKSCVAEQRIIIKSRNEDYNRRVFITNTPHGISVRDYDFNDRFNESRTTPIKAEEMELELYFEGRFLEVYANGYLIYNAVMEYKIEELEKIEIITGQRA